MGGKVIHGHSPYKNKSVTYNIWCCMRQRCSNPKIGCYERYGGRGIKVCERWQNSFENFLADMGEAPAGMQIDRINNDGNYEKDNCRWSTSKDQANNRRSNVYHTYRGKEYTISQLADVAGISMKLMWYRLSAGWSTDEAVETPRGKPARLVGDRRALRSDVGFYEHNGEVRTAKEWSKLLGLNPCTIRKRFPKSVT